MTIGMGGTHTPQKKRTSVGTNTYAFLFANAFIMQIVFSPMATPAPELPVIGYRIAVLNFSMSWALLVAMLDASVLPCSLLVELWCVKLTNWHGLRFSRYIYSVFGNKFETHKMTSFLSPRTYIICTIML